MVQVLKIGNLELSMGNLSLSVQKTSDGLEKYLRYISYQDKFNN
jgi:hypothetical protein